MCRNMVDIQSEMAEIRRGKKKKDRRKKPQDKNIMPHPLLHRAAITIREHIPWTHCVHAVNHCQSKRFRSQPWLSGQWTQAESTEVSAVGTLGETFHVLGIRLNLQLNLVLVNDYTCTQHHRAWSVGRCCQCTALTAVCHVNNWHQLL